MPYRRLYQFLLLYLAGLIMLFAVKYTGGLSDYVIPGPEEMWLTLENVVFRYIDDVLNTTGVAVVGHVLSIILAVFVGILGRLTNWMGALIRAASFNIQSYPIVAVAPIIFILLGDGVLSRLIIASLICYFPLLLAFLGIVSAPVSDIEHFYMVTGRSNWRLEVKIRIFENMSKMITVVVGSATLAMVGTIVAEFIAADAGIGYAIRIALYQGDLAKILVALFLIGICTSIYLSLLEWIGDLIQAKWNGTSEPIA